MYVGIAIVLAVLVLVYTRPPTRSSVALRRRVADVEETVDRDHVQLTRLIKRYRALEGHVYGSMEPDDDEVEETAAPAGISSADEQPASDFPESAFQEELARRRAARGAFA